MSSQFLLLWYSRGRLHHRNSMKRPRHARADLGMAPVNSGLPEHYVSFFITQAMFSPSTCMVRIPSASWATSPFSLPKAMFQ